MPLAIAGAGPSQGAARAVAPASEAARPDTERDGAAATGPADAVAISAAALSRLRLGTLLLAVQRLGVLLDALGQAARPADRGDPPTLAGLANEIGTAAQDIGAFFAGEQPAPAAAPVLVQANAAAGPLPADGEPDRGSVAAMSDAAGALLRTAAEALAVVKRRLQDAPAAGGGDIGAPAPSRAACVLEDVARCEAQIALATAQIAGHSPRTGAPGRDRHGRRGRIAAATGRPGAGRRGDPEKQLLLARAAFVAVLLCAAAAATWVATTLDLAPARAVCAAAAVVLCTVGAWGAAGPRLPRGVRIVVEKQEYRDRERV